MGPPRVRRWPRVTGAQAAKAPPADLQDLSVGLLAADVVLAGREQLIAEHHAALVDQAPGLRARDPELAG